MTTDFGVVAMSERVRESARRPSADESGHGGEDECHHGRAKGRRHGSERVGRDAPAADDEEEKPVGDGGGLRTAAGVHQRQGE